LAMPAVEGVPAALGIMFWPAAVATVVVGTGVTVIVVPPVVTAVNDVVDAAPAVVIVVADDVGGVV
jgi:hypothetical protein